MLQRQLWLSEQQRSRISIVYGPGRCGKTSLVLNALTKGKVLYFRTGSRTQKMQMAEFVQQIRQKLHKHLPEPPKDFSTLLRILFGYSTETTFSIVIDNIDYYCSNSPEVLSPLHELWLQYRDSSHINLILISEHPDMVTECLRLNSRRLSDIVDENIGLDYFKPSEVMSLCASELPGLDALGRLFLYSVSGCIPEYVERIVSQKPKTLDEILAYIISGESFFIKEGDNMLDRILGRNKDLYMSILQAIASGSRSQSEIESVLGGGNVGGHLFKLEKEYGLIEKTRPVLSGESSRNVVRFEIRNTFLLLWLRVVENHRELVLSKDYFSLAHWALNDYYNISKTLLIRYFKDKFKEISVTLDIGGDWKSNSRAKSFAIQNNALMKKSKSLQEIASEEIAVQREEYHEIDLISIDNTGRSALVAAIEIKPEDFDKQAFLRTLENIKSKQLRDFKIDSRLFTLEDM